MVNTAVIITHLIANTSRSTLLMLVSALVGGHSKIQAIYGHALAHDYRSVAIHDDDDWLLFMMMITDCYS